MCEALWYLRMNCQTASHSYTYPGYTDYSSLANICRGLKVTIANGQIQNEQIENLSWKTVLQIKAVCKSKKVLRVVSNTPTVASHPTST